MKFFKYWATATADVAASDGGQSVRCHGASDNSVEEAIRNAEVIAQRAATAIRDGSRPAAYAYSDRPLREEVIEEFTDGSAIIAIVSRNSYGSLILNSARALFADIDYAPATFLDNLRRLFLGRRSQEKLDSAIIQRVSEVCSSYPDLGVRLYRTANGFRALVTNKEFEPASREAKNLLQQLGSDSLYIKLCQAQDSFRARLSPKFWRCGGKPPPSRIPWETEEQEQAYRAWENDYQRVSSAYSTCAFVGSFGKTETHPSIETVLTIHDRLACSGDRPLA